MLSRMMGFYLFMTWHYSIMYMHIFTINLLIDGHLG
jgi:hypothetical protein